MAFDPGSCSLLNMRRLRQSSLATLPLFIACVCFSLAAEAGPRLSISLSTNSWRIGSVPVHGRSDTWLDQRGTFAVSNEGSVAVSLYISVTNSTPTGWVPDESPGWDRFSIGWSRADGRALPQYERMLASPGLLLGRLNTNEVFRFDLEFLAPTGSAQVGVEQQIRLTVLAVEE